VAVTATDGTFGWQKLFGVEANGAFEAGPTGRPLSRRRRLELGETRITFHDHVSGYTQVCVHVSTGYAVVLDAPDLDTPIVGVGQTQDEARLDAKHKANALGCDVKGLANG
jgi:hypothetical protein